jgi:hypothetical protein
MIKNATKPNASSTIPLASKEGATMPPVNRLWVVIEVSVTVVVLDTVTPEVTVETVATDAVNCPVTVTVVDETLCVMEIPVSVNVVVADENCVIVDVPKNEAVVVVVVVKALTTCR